MQLEEKNQTPEISAPNGGNKNIPLNVMPQGTSGEDVRVGGS